MPQTPGRMSQEGSKQKRNAGHYASRRGSASSAARAPTRERKSGSKKGSTSSSRKATRH